MRKWPSDPRSAEAGFRAGELLFGQKRFREALLSYGKVAEDFPRSDRAPAAMLGAAESMVRLEMKDEAAAVLGQLVERYPKSDAATKAQARLQEIAPRRLRPRSRRRPAREEGRAREGAEASREALRPGEEEARRLAR